MRNFRISALAFLATALLAAALSGAQGADVQHAIELQKSGDAEGAAREYRAFLAEHPSEPAIRSNLGVVLTQLGRMDEAIAEYNEAVRLDPANGGIRLNLALALYKTGRIPDAAAQLASLAGQSDQATLLLADCYLRTGENKKVIALLQPVSEKKPDDAGVTYLLGTALIRDGRIADGQIALDRILRQGNAAEAHFLLGTQMFAAGDFPAALKEFQRAATLNPNLPSLQSYYGQALLNTGDADGAAAAFRKELARDPTDFDSNLHLAEILLERHHAEEAAPLLERALLVRPGSQLVALALARSKDGAARRQSPLLGKPAPDFALPPSAGGAAIHLGDFRGKSPVLLVFGSYSCPNFRVAAPALKALYGRYGKRVPFLMVYIREAHSTADWQSTRNEREGIVIPLAHTIKEKAESANMCLRKLNLPFPAVVDGMDGKVETEYAAWPSHAYLVDAQGNIRYSTGLTELEFHADELEAAVAKAAR